jgi:uncharacterized membrane protein
MIEKIGLIILTTLAPISELRGGIPLGIALGLDPILTFFLAVFFNCLIFFPVYFGMKLFYNKILSKISIFNLYLKKLWKKGKPFVDKYGLIGLAIFVAIPFPLTGAYSGTFLGWLLGLKWKKAFLAVCLGVLIAGIIVLTVSLGLFGSI